MSPSPRRDEDGPHARDHVADDERALVVRSYRHTWPWRVSRRVQHAPALGDGTRQLDGVALDEHARDGHIDA